MILLKAFFRKKKTKIFINLLSTIIIVLLLLNSINVYIKSELNRLKQDTSTLIMFAQNNHDDLLSSSNDVSSYTRAISMEAGFDNEIIYTPKATMLPDGSWKYTEKIDYSKIHWNNLIYDFDSYPYILTFPSSMCKVELDDYEVVLALEKDVDYRKEYVKNYIHHDISLKYSDEEFTLKIKDIIEPKTFTYICISNRLYDDIVQNEKNYIYVINSTNYKVNEKLVKDWENLEDNDFYGIGVRNFYDEDIEDRISSLEFLTNMLLFVNILSSVIFCIAVIVIIKDLIGEEEKDILLLKEIGFNKWHNIGNVLRNMLVLDSIVFVVSVVIAGLITFILNYLFKFEIVMVNLECFMLLGGFVLFTQFLFSILFIRKY